MSETIKPIDEKLEKDEEFIDQFDVSDHDIELFLSSHRRKD